MDRVHVLYAFLLNLFSVQLTFCGTGEPLMFAPPSPFEMRSMSAPFIQAQFHPASGTIQQGIMIPPEHLMPQERMTPEELFLQMMPQERFVPPENIMVPSDRLMTAGSMMSEQRMAPHEQMASQQSIPHLQQQQNMHPERMEFQQNVPQGHSGSMMSEQRLVPHDQMDSQHSMPHLQQHPNHMQQERMWFQQNVPLGHKMPQERMMNQIMRQDRMEPQENIQKILHTSSDQYPSKHEEQNITSDLTDEVRGTEEDRTVKSGYDYPSHPHTYAPAHSYGYSSPTSSYSAHAPPSSSYAPSAAPTYPSPTHPEPVNKFLLKPDLTELIKPVTGKMAGKLNGLVGLVLSLLGSGKGLELTGLKDLLIDGILKPLFVAKGGIKALISKMSIPIIALILINLEVLITVWWLWEECPAPVIVKHDVAYSKPVAAYPAASYNYR